MGQWQGDEGERHAAGAPGGGGPRRGPVLLLVGVLVGALIALGSFLVVDRRSDDAAPDAAAVSSTPETTAPSDREHGDRPPTTEPTAPPTTEPTPTSPEPEPEPDPEAEPEPEPEPTNEPDIIVNGVNMIAPAAGTYYGVLSQRGTAHSDRDLRVAMSFSSTGSYVEYPSLGCSGTLTPTGNRSGARVYRETITSGQCDPTGTWYVTRGSESEISAEYRPEGDDHVVEGQLSR